MKYWFMDNFGWFVLGFCALMISLMLYGVDQSSKENDRLMAQCMSDGKKEYECVAMLKRNRSSASVVPMPVVVPIR